MDSEENNEEVYIVLQLDNVKLPEGQEVSLKDIDTDRPKLELPDGTVLEGDFEETLGTQMIFSTSQAERAGDGSSPPETEPTARVSLLCHTDKKITFHNKKK